MIRLRRPVFLLCTGLLAAVAILPFLSSSTEAQTRALGLLRREPATLFDLGIVYLRQRIDRVVNRQAVRADASANAFINPDLSDDPTIDINVTVYRPGGLSTLSCVEFRREIITKFLNLEEGGDPQEQATLIMGFAFLHRGLPADSPTSLGQEMSELFTVTVTHNGETCTGPLV